MYIWYVAPPDEILDTFLYNPMYLPNSHMMRDGIITELNTENIPIFYIYNPRVVLLPSTSRFQMSRILYHYNQRGISTPQSNLYTPGRMVYL